MLVAAHRAAALCLLACACSNPGDEALSTPLATGGASAAGGSAGSATTGGVATAPSMTGGQASGTAGSPSSGGTPATGGVTPGGASTGAAGAGGTATGGARPTGGATSPTGGSTAAAGAGGTPGGAGSSGNAGQQSGGSAGTTHTGVWNVMMLGDSITASTCYPQLLSQQLLAGGHTNFALLGSQTTSQSCNGAPPVKTEGHGGYGVTYLPSDSTRAACTKSSGCGSYRELEQWAALAPDIVLMHYGTNDVWDGQSAQSILAAYVSVLAEFRKHNPSVVFFVSRIIKLAPSGCANCSSNVMALADALTPDWASSNSQPSSPIHLVDHYRSGFDPSNAGDAADGVHPTPAGAMKMATASYAAVTALGYF